MARDYSIVELVAAVKRRAVLPTNQSTFTAERIAALLDEELQATLVPLVLSTAGEHLLAWEDYTLTDAVEYAVPSGAIGDRVREAVIIDPTTGQHLVDLAVVGLDRLHLATVYEPALTIRGSKLVMVPTSRPGATLRVYYSRRPSRLVWTTRAVQVTAVDSGTDTVTVSGTLPSALTTIGATVSVTPAVPPFEERDTAPTIVNAATPDLELSDVSGIEVGDWIALEGESALPQIPADLHAALAQRGAWRVLRALGSPASDAALVDYETLADAWVQIASPRVEGEARLVLGTDPIGDCLDRPWGWS